MKKINKMKNAIFQWIGILLIGAVTIALIGANITGTSPTTGSGPRNVIFFHPDGFGVSHWAVLRTYTVGPDGRLNWDRLPHMAPYVGRMRDRLTGTSHGGATTHAYGVKVVADSFGLDGYAVITALSGRQMSIMEEAIEAGFATALVQTGSLFEAGTAAFVASTEGRWGIWQEKQVLQVIESGVDVILSGGEAFLLPVGVIGRHGEGQRTDGANLIERARELGFTVVFTRDELMAAAADRAITKVLGVFAHGHTFNDMTEERLRAEGLPLFWPWAPTVAEMSEAALKILSRNPKAAERGIFLVAEEEGTDNFPNNANARGSFEAGRRADEAFGVFIDFIANNPNTLLITTADSNAGGKLIIERPLVDGKVPEVEINTGPDGRYVRAPLDGIDGANTAPFMSAPDRAGNRFPFAIAWSNRHDMAGGIVVRAKGLNAERVTQLGVVDNTDIYRIMYYTLFGKWLP